uniref:SGNH hydrolase-type esterase domain-containing protein n=1 Tax=Myripristis murdjan TaxID=586833 RepID=A0A667ZVX6_9TELE
MVCSDCSAFSDRMSLLERRVRDLEQLLSARNTLDITGTPDSLSPGPDRRPASASTSLASSAEAAGFVSVSRRGKARKSKSPVVWPGLRSPLPTANRFSPLSSPVGNPVGQRVSPAPVDRVEQRTLVIGDSITRNVRLASPAVVHCLPGARVSDIEDNLRVLAASRKKQGTQAHYTSSYKNIVIHVGTNNARMKQSAITKASLVRTLELARKMCRHRLVVSGPLPVRGNDEMYSRLTWPSFWGRPHLLKADGLHPTGEGAALLSSNIDRTWL